MAYHGHKLLEEHILKNPLLSGKVIIEVGSVREHMEGQNSTGFFMELCKKHNMKLVSVDMDPECSANVHKEAEKLDFKNYEDVYLFLDEKNYVSKYNKQIKLQIKEEKNKIYIELKKNKDKIEKIKDKIIKKKNTLK